MKLLQVPKQLDNIKYLLLTSAKQIEKSMKTKKSIATPQTIQTGAKILSDTLMNLGSSTKELEESIVQMGRAYKNSIPISNIYLADIIDEHSPSEEEVEEIIRQSTPSPPIFDGLRANYSPIQNTDEDEEKFDILVLNVLSGIQGKVPIGADTYKKILLLEAEGKDSKEIIGIILSGLNDKPKSTKRRIRL